MKKLCLFSLLILLCLQTLAAEDDRVKYVGGTARGIKAGMVGQLDTTSDSALIFEHSAGELEIPYASIQSFESSTQVARHLGVLPAMLVGLIRARQRRHFVRVSYHDPNGVPEAVVFEVPKRMPRTLQAILDARAPNAVKPNNPCGCGGS